VDEKHASREGPNGSQGTDGYSAARRVARSARARTTSSKAISVQRMPLGITSMRALLPTFPMNVVGILDAVLASGVGYLDKRSCISLLRSPIIKSSAFMRYKIGSGRCGTISLNLTLFGKGTWTLC
jgi:hypothetical protein